MPRKTLYQLSISHAQGLLPPEDYLAARRTLINDILSGKEPLREREYDCLGSGERTVARPEIHHRRQMAKAELQKLQQATQESKKLRRSRRIRYVLLALGVVTAMMILAGIVLTS